MKIQVDLPEELNKKLKIDRINFGLVSLQEMLIENLKRYYKLIEMPLFNKI
jgi:hypothetical protein